MAGIRRILMPALALLASYLMYYFSKLANDSPLVVSPQGCEMSWMSPHYILQSNFNKAWTPLASRYSLWLYREMGLDVMKERHGTPVLFIPGNAGSSRQVRSIASSAARQFYQGSRAPGTRPLDFFAVEFNEDFSAIHPPTLLSQKQYSSQAIRYILSLYPKGTKVIIIGHSMGGIVAQLLLDEIDDGALRAVYTMSTPSLLSPVRFDRRSDTVYSMAQHSQKGERNSTVPLITICGGSTDSQITAEICALPERETPLRRTIMTTSLEAAWTGVGHREMVWCHQVRSLVARSALSLAHDPDTNASIDKILRTRPTHVSASHSPVSIDNEVLHYVRNSNRCDLKMTDEGIYMLPLASQKKLRFTLFAYGVRFDDFGSEDDRPLETGSLRVLYCSRSATVFPTPSCIKLGGKLSLLPRQEWPGGFPASNGVHDDDAILMFEATIEMDRPAGDDHIAILIRAQKTERWVVAAVEEVNDPVSTVTIWDTLRPGGVSFSLPTWSKSLKSIIYLPKLFSHSIIVYRVEATYDGQCSAPRLPPLVIHKPATLEAIYHSPSHTFYLQSHRDGPFIYPMQQDGHIPSLTILSTAECGIQSLKVSLAWQETSGRLGVRYWMGLAMWSVAIVGVLQTIAWFTYDLDGTFRSTQAITIDLVSRWMLPSGCILVGLSALPLPRVFVLGNEGTWILSLLAFPIWFFACGLVCASQYILYAITSIFGRVLELLRVDRDREERATSMRWITSILFVLLLVATLIPFQVAFVAVFMIQLSACSSSPNLVPIRPSSPVTSSSPTPEIWRIRGVKQSSNFHILLLLTWLLPFAVPIVVVWVRTLQTAGYTVPFDGDHNIFVIVPWLLLGEAVASGRAFQRESNRWRQLVTYALTSGISATALLLGARFPYLVFEVATCFAAWLVFTRVQWKASDV